MASLSWVTSSTALPRTLLSRCRPRSVPLFRGRTFFPASRQAFRLQAMASLADASPSQKATSLGKEDEEMKFWEQVQTHEIAALRLSAVEDARTLVAQSSYGILATMSQKFEGFPYGSRVDFAVDKNGCPILAISTLAAHTKDCSSGACERNWSSYSLIHTKTRNRLKTTQLEKLVYCRANLRLLRKLKTLAGPMQDLQAFPKCSLVVMKDPADRSDTIISILGESVIVSQQDSEDARKLFLQKHPEAFWVDFGDFRFVRIEPERLRYLRGSATPFVLSCAVAEAQSTFRDMERLELALTLEEEIEGQDYKSSRIDPVAQFSKPIAVHMNKDHADGTKLIVEHSVGIKVEYANITDLDHLGLNVEVGHNGSPLKLRIPFPRPAEDRKDVKNLIVEMLGNARSAQGKD